MSNLKRYAVSLVLAALSVILFVIGVLGLTVWRPSQEVVATGSSEMPFVMTRPGVLPLYDDTVTVTVRSTDPSATVWMAVGSGPDVTAWLSGKPYDEIIGLGSLDTLKFVAQDGFVEGSQSGATDDSQSGAETPEPAAADPQSSELEEAQSGTTQKSPIASDMWTALYEGTGTLTKEFSGAELESSLLMATDGTQAAPQVTMTWSAPQPYLLATVAFLLGGVWLILAGVIALVLYRSARRRQQRAEELEDARQADDTSTSMIQAIPAAVLEKRSELKKPEEKPAPSSADKPVEPVKPVVVTAVKEQVEVAAPVKDVEEPPVPEKPAADNRRSENVPSDSGMINLAALQGGGAFPTRKALREAQERGVESLIVEGREFSVGATPAQPTTESSPSVDTSETSMVLGKRSTRHTKWRKPKK